jgi:uncharacterized membrane protein YczE
MDPSRPTSEELEELARMALSTNKALNLGVSVIIYVSIAVDTSKYSFHQPFVLGALFDALLCGIFLVQCGAYISSRNKDGLLIKALVAFVVAMNLYGLAFRVTPLF